MPPLSFIVIRYPYFITHIPKTKCFNKIEIIIFLLFSLYNIIFYALIYKFHIYILISKKIMLVAFFTVPCPKNESTFMTQAPHNRCEGLFADLLE